MEKIFRQRINRDDGMISRNENNVVRTSSMSEKLQTQRGAKCVGAVGKIQCE